MNSDSYDVCASGLCLSLFTKTHLEMHKALEQDSTVYDYDAVYDDIQKQRNESNKKLLGGADKKVISCLVALSSAILPVKPKHCKFYLPSVFFSPSVSL